MFPSDTPTPSILEQQSGPAFLNETVQETSGSEIRYMLLFTVLIGLGITLFSRTLVLENIMKLFADTTTQTINNTSGGSYMASEALFNKIINILSLLVYGDVETVNSKLDSDINTPPDPTTTESKPIIKPKKPILPLPDSSDSSIQDSGPKKGFCYIGEDRGVRSCINVREIDACMSGEVFPSIEKCINPNLR